MKKTILFILAALLLPRNSHSSDWRCGAFIFLLGDTASLSYAGGILGRHTGPDSVYGMLQSLHEKLAVADSDGNASGQIPVSKYDSSCVVYLLSEGLNTPSIGTKLKHAGCSRIYFIQVDSAEKYLEPKIHFPFDGKTASGLRLKYLNTTYQEVSRGHCSRNPDAHPREFSEGQMKGMVALFFWQLQNEAKPPATHPSH